jgi:peptidoglycan hydrolase-like protein with peptidoglycan-binding domain
VLKHGAADGSLQIEADHTDSLEQQRHLQTDGRAVPELDVHPSGGPRPNVPPGGDVPASLLSPPLTATLPGGRSPQAAALQLLAWLQATRRFGSSSDRPAEVRSAQEDLGITADGIVGPQTRARAAAVGVELPRSPAEAARALRVAMSSHAPDRAAQIRAAQVDLGVEPDGLVGPKTRAAAKKAGVSLPAKG